jgi:hypothetical protein
MPGAGGFWYDKTFALITTIYGIAVTGSRWSVYTITQRTMLCVFFIPLMMSFFILPHFFESFYRRWRTPLILGLKGLGLVQRLDGKPLVRFQVRLNSPPQGVVTDLVSAFIGAPEDSLL